MSNLSPFDDQPTHCPQCGAHGPIPIVYGAPSQEMLIAARLGEIVLGQLPPEDAPPLWACARRRCGFAF